MIIYALVHHAAGDRVVAYEGMDEAAVSAMMSDQNLSFDFMDSSTYAAFILSHQPVPPTPAQLLALVHSEAAASATTGVDPGTTLQRAAALVIMDQLNIIRQRIADTAADVAAATSLADLKTRWAARPALPQLSGSQIVSAIQAKINAGAAD